MNSIQLLITIPNFLAKKNNGIFEYIIFYDGVCLMKRYFKIDQHLARHFEYYGECLLSLPPFLCSKIIISF